MERDYMIMIRNALIWFCIMLAVSVAAALIAHT